MKHAIDSIEATDELKAILKSLTDNVYIVNQKQPPGYDRKWCIHILHKDGTTSDHRADDSRGALNSELRRACQRLGATP